MFRHIIWCPVVHPLHTSHLNLNQIILQTDMIEQRTFCFQRFFKISAKYLYHGPLAPGNTLLSLSCCCFLPRPPPAPVHWPPPPRATRSLSTLPSAHSWPGLNIIRGCDILLSQHILKTLKIMMDKISGETVPFLLIFNSSSRWLQIIFVLNPALL